MQRTAPAGYARGRELHLLPGVVTRSVVDADELELLDRVVERHARVDRPRDRLPLVVGGDDDRDRRLEPHRSDGAVEGREREARDHVRADDERVDAAGARPGHAGHLEVDVPDEEAQQDHEADQREAPDESRAQLVGAGEHRGRRHGGWRRRRGRDVTDRPDRGRRRDQRRGRRRRWKRLDGGVRTRGTVDAVAASSGRCGCARWARPEPTRAAGAGRDRRRRRARAGTRSARPQAAREPGARASPRPPASGARHRSRARRRAGRNAAGQAPVSPAEAEVRVLPAASTATAQTV